LKGTKPSICRSWQIRILTKKDAGVDREIGEDEEHARHPHRAGHDEPERGVEDEVPPPDGPPPRGGLGVERDLSERPPDEPVKGADRAVEDRERADLGRRDRHDASDQKLLDVLASLRRAVDDEHGRRGRHRVDDADDRLLGDGPASRPAHGKEPGAR